MKTVKLDINYTEYSSIDEMEPQDIELVKAAIEAQKGSYAPYSTFNVGAALRLEDGTIVKGRTPPILPDFAPRGQQCSPPAPTIRARLCFPSPL